LYGEALLSRVLDANDTSLLTKHGITRDDLPTTAEREVYDAIVDYANTNGGLSPGFALITADHPEFTYVADDGTATDYMAKRIKDASGKRLLAELLNSPALAEQFEKSSSESFAEFLTKSIEQITLKTTNTRSVGKSLTDLKTEFRDEYEKRKAGKSSRQWLTPFPTLNEQIGGFYSGDIYGVMAESGRGKSYLIIKFIDGLLRQGAKVLVKSYELKSYLWLSRLFSILTAEEGIVEADGGQRVGLPNRDLLSGKLTDDLEAYFLTLLDAINEYYSGELILQAKGESDLTRTLNDLDRELTIRTDIDAVVVDPFYGLDDVYGRNANKTSGGAAEQAARRFEQIIGKHDVVGIYAVQATVEKQGREEDGCRELKLPTRDQVKTSKALLEIATILFAFDSNDGTAILGVDKGRNGGEGVSVPLTALMDYGIIRELPKGEAVANQFSTIF
jgi:replicative DNA helicase